LNKLTEPAPSNTQKNGPMRNRKGAL